MRHVDERVVSRHPATGIECWYSDKAHEYWTRDIDMVSVTTFVKHYFPPFDIAATAKRVAERDGVEPQVVVDAWELNRVTAAEMGKRIHAAAEGYALHGAAALSERSAREVGMTKQAKRVIALLGDAGWRVVGAESVIFSEALAIAGTVDLLLADPKGKLWVLDWKTSKEINTSAYAGAVGMGPCGHLPDANFYHYSLQLNTYAEIIWTGGWLSHTPYPERGYPGMIIIHLKEDDFVRIDVPEMRLEVNAMLLDKAISHWDELAPF